jgi:hypothetical protein
VRLLWNWTAADEEAASTAGHAPPGRRRLAAGPPTMVGTLESADPAGYASWGWPSTPGKMAGGRVLVLKACPTCPTGAEVGPFALTGYTSASVRPDPAALALGSGTEAGVGRAPAARLLPGGAGLAADFSLTPPADVAAVPAAAPFIAATGPLKPDGRLAIHGWTGAGDLDLGAGGGSGSGGGGGGGGGFAPAPSSASLAGGPADTPAAKTARKARNRRILYAHGICMVLAWCFLVPIAVGLSAAARDGAGRWFKGHWMLNAAAAALSVAGLGLGRAHPAAHKPRILAHSVIGYVIVGAALVLALAGAVRPARHSPRRGAWGWLHRGGGLLTAAVAFANTIAGFWLARAPIGWPVGVGLAWVALVAGFGGKALADWRAGKPVGGGVPPGAAPLASVVPGAKAGGGGGGGGVQMMEAGGGGAGPTRTLSATGVKGSAV